MKLIGLGALIGILFFEGCSREGAPELFVPPEVPGDEPTEEPVTGPLVNVRDFGARGDGSTDDSNAFDAALRALPSTGGTLFVPAGVYMLRAIHANPNSAIDLTGRFGVTIRGEGADATSLRMAPATYPGETHMILVQDATGITIEKLMLDGNRAFVTYRDEQSHGIQVVSSSDTRIREVTFQNSGGDGVRIFGAPQADKAWSDRVLIEDSHFQDMTRNGISLQRAARFVEIRRNTFDRVSDQSISSEPSGVGAPTDVLIEDNVVRHTTGAWAVALAGIRPGDVLQRMTFRNNRIENGAAYFLWTDGLVVSNNLIRGDRLHSPLRIHAVTGALIEGNDLTALAEEGTGTLQIVSEDNALPARVTVRGNILQVAAGLSGIHVRDAASDIEIADNTIIGNDGNRGISIDNVLIRGQLRKGFKVTENEIQNFSTSLTLVTRGDSYEDVEIFGNSFDHDQEPPVETIGILFDRTGPVETFAQVELNHFGSGIVTSILVRGQ